MWCFKQRKLTSLLLTYAIAHNWRTNVKNPNSTRFNSTECFSGPRIITVLYIMDLPAEFASVARAEPYPSSWHQSQGSPWHASAPPFQKRGSPRLTAGKKNTGVWASVTCTVSDPENNRMKKNRISLLSLVLLYIPVQSQKVLCWPDGRVLTLKLSICRSVLCCWILWLWRCISKAIRNSSALLKAAVISLCIFKLWLFNTSTWWKKRLLRPHSSLHHPTLEGVV